ncbi:MAG TPA: hypothetical protein DDZ19_00960 [Flavobacteriales bacterium]|nr:hypothetical protein [Flavobacteriales bacterium]
MDAFHSLSTFLRYDTPKLETSTEEQVVSDSLLDTLESEGFNLVLYNDEHNTFDHVINMLVAVCNHDAMQAEQCALMVHFKGKCAVMSGTYDELEPKCTGLLEADLTAEIEA